MLYDIVTSDNDFFRECHGTLWNFLTCLMEWNWLQSIHTLQTTDATPLVRSAKNDNTWAQTREKIGIIKRS